MANDKQPGPEREYCQEYIDLVDGPARTLSASEFYNKVVLVERERCAQACRDQAGRARDQLTRRDYLVAAETCELILDAIRRGPENGASTALKPQPEAND